MTSRADAASAPKAGKALGYKELMKMMVRGDKVDVLKYLRTLPPEEGSVMRKKLLRGLEVIQNKGNESDEHGSSKGSGSQRSKGVNLPSARRDSSDETIRTGSPSKTTVSDVPIQFQSSVERCNTELAGRYRAIEVIGKGGFGTVLKGASLETGEYVAIKQIDKFMIDANQLPGIMKEAEILKRLNHANIVKIYSFMETPHTLYFVLEFVESGSLAGLVKKLGVFPEHLIASYTIQTLHGLRYLHEEGIIHRDIKGDNILITKDGKVKLADFGTAKLEDADKKTQTVVGTPYWMAPEVIEMSACGPTSDIWSLGCTVIELLTGAPPYFELGPMSALFNIVEDRHPPLPENLSEDLRSFLKVCFKKDPRQRPTAMELVEHKWLKKYSSANGGDFEAVSGTLRQHNQKDKKNVMNIFGGDSGASTSPTSTVVASPGSDKKRKNEKASDKPSEKPTKTKSKDLGLSLNTSGLSSEGSMSSSGAVSPRGTPTSPRAGIPTSPRNASPAGQGSTASGGTGSKKKLAKAKTQDADRSSSSDHEDQKKEKLSKERQAVDAQLDALRRENQLAEAQLAGMRLLLKHLSIENKEAKAAAALIRTVQDALGKDTYTKLAYGHLSRQMKSIRPAAILEADQASSSSSGSRARSNSF